MVDQNWVAIGVPVLSGERYTKALLVSARAAPTGTRNRKISLLARL